MYNTYFGFSDSPFENNLDQRFLFLSEDHNEVLAALLYFIRANKGFALLCGDVGTGKTMLINCFLDRLPESVNPVIISNPTVEYQEILFYVAQSLGISNDGKSVLELIDKVKKALIEAKTEEKQYVLIIDEAHLLSDQSLEHIRLLSNIETPVRKLLQILLVGQYELSYKLDRPEMRQLRQRISINRFLSTLDSSETIHYIDHRLKVVGSSFDSCFESDSKQLIYKLTDGVPRLTNQICDNALLICKAEGLRKVNKDVLRKADEALRSDLIFTPKSFKAMTKRVFSLWKPVKPLPLVSACILFLIIVGILSYTVYFGKSTEQTEPMQLTTTETLPEAMLEKPQDIENKANKPITPDPKNALVDVESHPEPQKEDSPPPQSVSKNTSSDTFSKVLPIPIDKTEKASGITERKRFTETRDALLPLPRKVLVKEGDTLAGIAYLHYPKKMKEGVDAILEANPDITKRGMIYPGQELILPRIDSRHTSLPKPVAEGKTYFTVQVCALLILGKDAAETFTNELRQKGYPAYYIEIKTKKGKYIYKIRIGRYKTRAEAREVALSFQKREKMLFLIFKSEIDISRKFLQDESASDPSAEERNTGLPEYSDDEERLHVDNMTQKKQEKIKDKDIKGKAVANNQIIEFKLRDDLHYSLYGNYSSMEEVQKVMAQLKQKKVKFLVDISNDHDGTTTHRIILGGYEKVEELNKAIESLKVKTE